MILSVLESRIASDLDGVRAAIRMSEEMRKLLAEGTEGHAVLAELTKAAPSSALWRVYDHCAAMSRLYALYERFLEDLAAEWLSYLPTLWPSYGDLADRVRRTHREGVGRVLTRLDYRRYRAVNAVTLLDGLRDGLSATVPYSLEPIAFVDGDRNYRPEVVRGLFAAMGIDEIWPWVQNHRFVTAHIAASQQSDATLEALVEQFVDYRNDAAHGSIDEVLAAEALLEMTSLVGAIAKALIEGVRDHVVDGLLRIGKADVRGKITEVFEGPGAVVVPYKGSIAVGDLRVLRGTRTCRVARIESIRVEDQDCTAITTLNDTELGLRVGSDVRKNLEVVELA